MEIQTPNQAAYDRAIVVFSPEGRMYQVEYARKAVLKATTTLGIVYNKGVVLAAVRSLPKNLVPSSSTKISKIDEHIAIASCGIIADARVLSDFARIRSQVNRITFNEPIEVGELAKQIGDRKQRFTQVGGIRPFGISLLIGGYDDKPALYETDPSGVVRQWFARAIGRGAKGAEKVLEKEYKQSMTKDAAITLANKALKAAESEGSIEIGVVEEGKFYRVEKTK